jgi:chromate transport protein ChrA
LGQPLVERRGWLSEPAFNETLALCQALPGPNIVNMSVVRELGPVLAATMLAGRVGSDFLHGGSGDDAYG